jgi:hypothetical protein
MRNLIQCGAISLGRLRGEFLSLNKAIAVESGCWEQAAKSTVRARDNLLHKHRPKQSAARVE